MINFLHSFHPSPIIFSFGPVNIYWYGVCIVAGIIAAILVALKLARFYNIEKDTIIDLAFWLVLAGILGARIYHILLELPYYAEYPLDIFKIWQGGLAIHGAIIAGIIVIFIFAKKLPPLLTKEGQGGGLAIGAISHETSPNLSLVRRGNSFWLLASLIAPGLALAQAVGRWGNYFNQENFGGPTSLSWGIPINPLNRPAEYISSRFFHPAFLYESIGNLIIFIVLLTLHFQLIKRVKNNLSSVISYKLLVISYLIMYSILRFSLEFIRIDPTPELLGLRWPQIMSILIIIASIIMLLKNKKNYANINTRSYNN